MRICLISASHLSTCPRLVKEADALSEAGHEVIVVTGSCQSWARETDMAFAARPWRIRPPVTFGPLASPTRQSLQSLQYRAGNWLVRHGVKQPLALLAAWHHAALDLVAAACRVKADLYVGHYLEGLGAAAIAARLRKGAYAFDAADFHPGELTESPKDALWRKITALIERRFLPGCAFITAASPLIADAYAGAYAIERPTVVLNAFPLAQAPASPTAVGALPLRPSVYWFSIALSPHRGLESAVRALARAQTRPHLFLRGVVDPGYAGQLENIAREAGVVDRLHFLPSGPPAEMERLAAAYDVGLSTEPGDSLNNRLALGNKLFSYLLAGVPIVASDVPAHRRFAPDLGDAVRLFEAGDAASLGAALDSLLASDSSLAAARAQAWRLGQERFNWEREKSAFLGCVERAFERRAAT